MGIIESVTLLGIMMTLAAMPSASVILVVTRAATLGVRNGIAVACGIVLGDLFFVVLAMLGLSAIAETMSSLFVLIKYLGAIYMIFLGFNLLMKKDAIEMAANKTCEKSSLIASLLAGFILTLGDIKAIFFYISLLPIFINLSALQTRDMLMIVAMTIIGVGGVKILYALSASKIAIVAKNRKFDNAARKTAGGLMIGAGGYLIVKN
ncbi:MAG: LysE family translocator [Gammaproteobacteria bacterium]|nr:LysE family translocator [Gammaproteobacteria bacterium]